MLMDKAWPLTVKHTCHGLTSGSFGQFSGRKYITQERKTVQGKVTGGAAKKTPRAIKLLPLSRAVVLQ